MPPNGCWIIQVLSKVTWYLRTFEELDFPSGAANRSTSFLARVPAPYLSDVPLLVRRKQRCARNLFPEFFGQHPDLSGHQSGIFVAAVLAESLEGETQRVVIQRFRVVAVKQTVTKPAAGNERVSIWAR